MGLPRQEYRSGLPFPSPGDLPDSGIKPASPALQADSLPLSHQEHFLGGAVVEKKKNTPVNAADTRHRVPSLNREDPPRGRNGNPP